MADRPHVSVIVAAYNRSNVIGYAIDSVRHQSMDDWELLIVDDCSSDDTAAVVQSIADARIRYVQLGANFGDQSGPNNVGMLLARGELIAFVNQDDLWFPDHLEHSIRVLDRENADLVFARMAILRPTPIEELAIGNWSFHTQGRGHRGKYRPGEHTPASGWVFRRDLVSRVGLWRSAHEVHATASSEWMFRAHKAGARLVSTELESVMTISAGIRAGSYADRIQHENAYFAKLLSEEPELRARVVAAIEETLPPSVSATRAERRNLWLSRWVRRQWQQLATRTIAACGLNPLEIRFAARHRGKGQYFDELNRTRGLNG